ncbi:MAG: DUF72 domain-containing protein [Polyangiaceae bacterium]
MTTRYHIGARELRGKLEAYTKHFGLLEVKRGEPSSPNLTAMKRFRKVAPPAFSFAVVAPEAVCALKPGPKFEAALEDVLEAQRVLEARCVVLRTPFSVTPSKLSRDRLKALLDRFPQDALTIVWEPGGVWEAEEAARQAKKWNIVLAVDAAREAVPAGPVAYVRLKAFGETRGFSPETLARIANAIGSRRDAYVVIESDRAKDEAKSLRAAARDLDKAKPRPTSVLRPARVIAGGDEDE